MNIRTVLDKMIGAGDLIKEESRVLHHGGQPETVVPRYSKVSPFGELDYERFTTDLDWMPNVVLMFVVYSLSPGSICTTALRRSRRITIIRSGTRAPIPNWPMR